MTNKRAGISEVLLRPVLSGVLFLLLRRELLGLAILGITLLRHLLILRLRDLLITVGSRLILLNRHAVRLYGLRRDRPETLTDRDLFSGMGEPVCHHEDPERAEQDHEDPNDRCNPCKDYGSDLFAVVDP